MVSEDAFAPSMLLAYQLFYIVHTIFLWLYLTEGLPNSIVNYCLLVFSLLPAVVCTIVYALIHDDMEFWDYLIIYLIMFGYILLSIAIMSLVSMQEKLRKKGLKNKYERL